MRDKIKKYREQRAKRYERYIKSIRLKDKGNEDARHHPDR